MNKPLQLDLFGEIVGVARDLPESHRVLRDYAETVNLSREKLDDLSGLPSGYSAKLLCDPPRKHFGMMSFWSMVGALGLAVAFIKDKRRQKRTDSIQKRAVSIDTSKHWRNAKALACAQDIVKKTGKIGGSKRWQGVTKESRSDICRRAANARWRAHRRHIKLAKQALIIDQ